jgi:hypothetical protein
MNTPAGTELLAAAMDARIAALEADLAANPDPRVVELRDLKRMRPRYPKIESPSASPTSPQTTTAGTTQSTLFGANGNGTYRKGGRKMSPEREQALAALRAHLTGRTTPTLTANLLRHIESLGIVLKGEDKQSNLSALLYKTRGFKSHRRSGWTYEPEARQ